MGSHGGFGKAAEGLLTRLAATAGLRGGTYFLPGNSYFRSLLFCFWAKLRSMGGGLNPGGSMVSINAAVQRVHTSGFIYGTDDLPERFNDIL